MNVFKFSRIFAASLLMGAAAATPLAAQGGSEVMLRSADGTVNISGNLVALENGVYIIDTQMGQLRVAANTTICEGVGCPSVASADPRFGIYGSRTVGTTLIPNLLRGWAESNGATFEIENTADETERVVRIKAPDGTLRHEIFLQMKGSGTAFPALGERTADIGVADRRMNDADLATLRSLGLGELRDTPNETVLGVDGIVMITHRDNPVRNLSAEEVSRIYSGEITNWMELGGGNHPIRVNTYAEGSGDREVMLNGLVRPTGRDETAQVIRHDAYQDLVDAVMADRGGIGFVGRWLAATNDVNMLSVREECGLLSDPSDFRMKIEGYSLSRRLYAYTRPGDIHPDAKAFLDWTLTKEAQRYIKQSHFIDRELERMRLEDMGMMLIHTAAVEPDFNGAQYSQMMSDLRNADRLSVSFRFSSGSAELDSESVRNLRELADRMEAGEFDGFEVLLVGFADSIGDQARNTQLAQARAQSVRNILSEQLGDDVESRLRLVPLSYGELLPLSCNGDDIGRARNRRVEVWLRLPNSRISLR